MKHSKEQPPAHERKTQGVYIHLTDHSVEVRPYPQRIQNITTTIQTALTSNTLDPSLAQKLAGKCSFTAMQLFGKVGRAASRTLYDHAFSHQHTISRTTRQGLMAMLNVLQHAQPRTCILRPQPSNLTLIYTDAFYTIDGTNKRCSELTPEDIQQAHKDLSNGWGIVVFSPD